MLEFKKNINKYWNRYIEIWWLPPIISTFIAGISWYSLSLGILIPNGVQETLIDFGFLSLLFVIISGIINLIRKNWVLSVMNIISFFIIGPIFIFGIQMISMFGPSEDGFGRNIVIPPDMKYEEPLSYESVHLFHKKEIGIRLTNGIQGGMYLIDAQFDPGESGVAWVKVFEATQGTRLSEDRIDEKSRKKIDYPRNYVGPVHYSSEITVYEGDWEHYYPARFELWFKSGKNGQERKMLEKIFKIEGWQR